jgi:hypothetical protein
VLTVSSLFRSFSPSSCERVVMLFASESWCNGGAPPLANASTDSKRAPAARLGFISTVNSDRGDAS